VTTLAGHGPNIGHGFVKYVIIDNHGAELEPIVFPAQVARASGVVAGALSQIATVQLDGLQLWVGDDAQYATSAQTILSQERLSDPLFIPALVAGALARFGHLNGASAGVCVSGLPATWAEDLDKARALGARLRAGSPHYRKITVIPEPLGLAYAALLDNNGQVAGDSALANGRIATVDLGHLTVDRAELLRLAPIKSALDTYALGTKGPLGQIRARLSAHVERELTLVETDLAIRHGVVRVAGRDVPLPSGWDRPLVENGQAVRDRLVEAWGSGNQFEVILLGGGGAELPQITEAIMASFPHAMVVDRPQTAIARGYARLARRQAATL
jgi:hypothetical protein